METVTATGLGTRLGRYEIDATLSGGNMGSVYRAHDVETGASVVLKRVHENGHASGFNLTAAKTEARLLSFLRHPRVAVVVDHFHDPDGHYTLVTGFVEGPDLQRVLWDRGKPGLPVAEVLERAHEALDALAYIHSQQVVHADVKPANSSAEAILCSGCTWMPPRRACSRCFETPGTESESGVSSP